MNICATNYSKGIKSMPVEEYHKKERLEYDEQLRELSINKCLFVHVFDKIPYMRNISCNKHWFEQDIYHTK